MKIRYCTFTGVDDAVDPASLAAVSEQYPFAEWGVTYNPEWFGQKRSPTLEWINLFCHRYPSIEKSIHLCENGLTQFMSGDEATLKIIAQFNRVQLNLDLPSDRTPENVTAMIAQMKKLPQQYFILGYNSATADLLPLFKDVEISVLFDESYGTGKFITQRPSPLPGYFCGYAGGINPGTIDQVLQDINDLCTAEQETWIDMGSGVRNSDNMFDPEKVVAVLEKVKPFVR